MENLARALREQEALYRLVVDSLVEHAVLTIDLDGRIMSWNEGARRVFGYEPDEAIGQVAAMIFLDEDVARGLPEQEFATARDHGRAEDERWHLRKDGTWFWGSGIMSPLYDDQDRVAGYVKIVRDLTQRREYELRMEQANEVLERRVQQRTEQLRAAGAELTRAEQRERHRIAGELHDHLAQLLLAGRMRLERFKASREGDRESIDAVLEMLDESLQYVRTLISELSPPILHERGLREALEWLAARQKRQYELEVTVEGEAPLDLPEETVATLFRGARELLVNVARHADTDTAVVRLSQHDGVLELTVEDQGGGFDPNAIERVAERGTGFGLFSLRERLQLLGGGVRIESDPDRGTRITLSVPLPHE